MSGALEKRYSPEEATRHRGAKKNDDAKSRRRSGVMGGFVGGSSSSKLRALAFERPDEPKTFLSIAKGPVFLRPDFQILIQRR